MIDALICGKLLKTPEIKIGKSGQPFVNFLLSVPTDDGNNVLASGIAFGDVAERIAKLQNGDVLSVTGSLKMSSWLTRDNETKHGLYLCVLTALSAYDIKKHRGNGNAKPTENAPPGDYSFNEIPC